MKLIATFALRRIALRRHPVKSPKNYTIFLRILPFVPKIGFFSKMYTRNKLGDVQTSMANKLDLFYRDLGMAFLHIFGTGLM